MGKSRSQNKTKSKVKARQAAKKNSNTIPKIIIPKGPTALSTTNDVNPKSTNTYDRPPSPIIEECDVANHDTISENSNVSPEIATYKDAVKKSSPAMSPQDHVSKVCIISHTDIFVLIYTNTCARVCSSPPIYPLLVARQNTRTIICAVLGVHVSHEYVHNALKYVCPSHV